jgi:hypothetical protein
MIPFPHTYSAPVRAQATPGEAAERPEPVHAAPSLLAHIRAARAERLRQEAQRPRQPWYLRWPGVLFIGSVMFFGSVYVRQEQPAPRIHPAPITEGGQVILTYDVDACFFTGSSNCRRLRTGQRMIADNRDSRGNIRLLYRAGDQIGWWVPVGAIQGVAAP